MTTAARGSPGWRVLLILAATGLGLALPGLLDLLLDAAGAIDLATLRYAPGTVCDDNPASLGCLLSDLGGAGAGAGAAASGGGGRAREHTPGMAPESAPDTPEGYDPDPDLSGFEAVNDPAFQAQRDAYARDHSDKSPLPGGRGPVEQATGNFGRSLREFYGRK